MTSEERKIMTMHQTEYSTMINGHDHNNTRSSKEKLDGSEVYSEQGIWFTSQNIRRQSQTILDEKKSLINTTYCCNQCKFTTSSQKDLISHMKTDHNYSCLSCDYQTEVQQDMINHIERNHTYCCLQCEYKTRSQKELNLHINEVHTYFCLKCQYKTASQQELQRHNDENHNYCLLYTSDAADE